MSKRKWTDVSRYSQEISEMRQAGYSRQEIADTLGLEKFQIKNWINQQNRAQRRVASGMPPKAKSRPRKHPLTTTEVYEKRLHTYRWKTSCCGIFCNPQKGREAKGKVCGNLSSPG